jgi:energy-coupling factor transporter ATP-binding protein EcfA2
VDLSENRIWLVTGPMGSGKSTLLRLIAGVVRPESGRVVFPEGWSRGYLPQFPEAVMGGRHLAEDLLGTPVPDSADRARARAVLRRLGVDASSLRRPAACLSAGERRRASLALLLLAAPEVWAVDEPEAGLDPPSTARMLRVLEEAPARLLVIATHRFELFRALKPGVLVLEKGGLAAAGTLEQVLADPHSASALNVFNRPAGRVWSELRKYRSDLPENVWETSRNAPPLIMQVQALLTDSAPRA